MLLATRVKPRRQRLWQADYAVRKHVILRIVDATDAPLPVKLHHLGRREA